MSAYIFDVDGTIWDSTNEVAVAWSRAARDYGAPYEHITGDRLKREFGKLIEEIGDSLFPDMTREEAAPLLAKCTAYENEYLEEHGPEPYEGIRELFEALTSLGDEIYIVSNCLAGYIEAMLKKTGMEAYVKDHLCPGDTGKAKAENIKEIIKRNQLTDAVYIGDTEGDYRSATEAGIPFIFCAYGFGHVENPHATIHSPLELLSIE